VYSRIVYGLLAGAATIALMMFDALIARYVDSGRWPLLTRGSLIPLLFTAVMVAAALEAARLLRRMGHHPHTTWAVAMGALLMLSPWLAAGRVLGGSIIDVEALPWQIVWLIVAILGAAVLHLRRGASPGAPADIACTLLIITYLGFLPSFAVLLRCDFDIADPAEGMWVVMIVLLLAFTTDIGALFVGLTFGRRRFAPTISPKKSVEGAVGGLAATILVAVILWFQDTFTDAAPDAAESLAERLGLLLADSTAVLDRMTMGQVLVFAAAISVATQAGDLFESLLKRGAQVKDSSALIPGMGGILDVIDGVIFAMPVAWFLLTRTWQVV